MIYYATTLFYKTSDGSFWLPLIISSLALVVSIIALWWNHLRPYKLEVIFSKPTFRTYFFDKPKKVKKGEYYASAISSIDMNLVFLNTGSKAGRVKGLRLLLRGRNDVREMSAKWIVDYKSFNKHKHARFTWLSESIKSDWAPFFVLPRENESRHIVFEGFNIEDISKDDYIVILQIRSGKSDEWEELESWSFTIDDWVIGELKDGSSFTLPIDFNNPESTLED